MMYPLSGAAPLKQMIRWCHAQNVVIKGKGKIAQSQLFCADFLQTGIFRTANRNGVW